MLTFAFFSGSRFYFKQTCRHTVRHTDKQADSVVSQNCKKGSRRDNRLTSDGQWAFRSEVYNFHGCSLTDMNPVNALRCVRSTTGMYGRLLGHTQRNTNQYFTPKYIQDSSIPRALLLAHISDVNAVFCMFNLIYTGSHSTMYM